MNKILALLLTVIFMIGCTQKSTQSDNNPANDSVKKYLALAETDSLDFKQRVLYNDKAFSFIDLSRNDSLTTRSIYKISYNYYVFNKEKALKKTAESLLKISTISNDSTGLGYYHRNIGLYYMLKSKNEKAIEHLFKAKGIFKSLKNELYVNKIMVDIIFTQSYACDYLGSNKTAFELLKKNESNKDLKTISSCFNLIANNLSGLKQHSKAINYYLKAIKISPKIENRFTIYNNLAQELIIKGQFNEAEKYLENIISSKSNKSKFPKQYAVAESLLALSKIESNKDTTVTKLLIDADSILKVTNSPVGYNYNQINFSKLYAIKGDTIKAIYFANKALKVSEDYKNPTDILHSLSQLIKLDKKNATKNALKYIEVNDSLQHKERSFRDKFAQIKFETEEINQEREAVLKQNSLFITLAIAVFLIAVLVFIIARQRLKQKELSLKNTQQKANEEIYQLMLVQKAKEEEARRQEKKRIALELHDGVMNKLTSTRLNLSVLSIKKDTDTVDRSLPHIDKIKEIENEIRNLTHNLNSKNVLGENSYEKLLSDLVTEQNQISATVFELKINPEVNWGKTTDIQKMNLYRILQEACQNIHKHSKAKKARIHFYIDNHKLCLQLSDDGIGIQPNNPKKGIGLKNIKYRVKELNGKFNVSSKVNQGTTLTVSIPL